MRNIENEIFNTLLEDGFQNSSAIASRLGLSPKMVQRRIKQMNNQERFKVIVVPNFVELGFKAWARIGLVVDPALLKQVVSELIKHKSIYFVAYSIGAYDIVISVDFPNMRLLHDFANIYLNNIEGIISKEILLLEDPVKYYRFRWPVKNTANDNIAQNTGRHIIDELDIKIIQTWMDNALITAAMIHKKLGVPYSIIRSRMRYLKDNHLVNLEVRLNEAVLNYVWVTIGIKTKSKSNIISTLQVLAEDPRIYLVSRCFGRFDIIIAAYFPNLDALMKFTKTKLGNIEGISAIETCLHGTPLKYHNLKFDNLADENPEF